jgi:chemotaxis protein methyltransferase CheR
LKPEGERWRIRADIRDLATFRTLNLLQDFSYLGQFDVIFCRNVGIYFSEHDRAPHVRMHGSRARARRPPVRRQH